ncbi:MAG: 16S rRNA (cytosine(1402)-N(4))-methyltransferase RsmH [Tannerella sp.]|nr:16S rRNA (cytosine(1402)-N(4))-methyltransferase RsmH [Tannerella sp.]
MSDKELKYHIPALLRESLEGLNIKPSGTYVDATFGGGGHSRGILERLDRDGRLYGFDQDADSETNIVDDRRFVFVRSNFRYLSNFMRYHNESSLDGIIADLGLSSHHLDDTGRGFSFRFGGERLDLRMNSRGGTTAAEALNTYPEERLANIFYLYGELRQSRRIAAAAVARRQEKPFETVSDLLEILAPFASREKEKKFLAQAFQSLRIEINHEMQALGEMLEQSLKLLDVGGRLVVITYHSLEDRMVKNFMKAGNTEGKIAQDIYGNLQPPLRPVGKAITPSAGEVETNPRVRSARMRIAEKT